MENGDCVSLISNIFVDLTCLNTVTANTTGASVVGLYEMTVQWLPKRLATISAQMLFKNLHGC